MAMNALVTGAGARLGRAMAVALAEAGYDVAVHYAGSKEGAEDTARMVRDAGRMAAVLQADLLDEGASQGLVPAAAKALNGPITVLVNNASVFDYDNIRSATRDSWDRHMEANLRAPFVLTQCLAEQMPDPLVGEDGEKRAQGLIVNLLDQRVRKLTPEFTSYTISKMGLWALTQTSARALAPRVRVNAIGPGSTLQGAKQSAEQFAQQRQNSILQRGPNPEDITAALLYFLNAPAVTGQLICVDGGQHLGWKTPDILGV